MLEPKFDGEIIQLWDNSEFKKMIWNVGLKGTQDWEFF